MHTKQLHDLTKIIYTRIHTHTHTHTYMYTHIYTHITYTYTHTWLFIFFIFFEIFFEKIGVCTIQLPCRLPSPPLCIFQTNISKMQSVEKHIIKTLNLTHQNSTTKQETIKTLFALFIIHYPSYIIHH